MRKKRTNVADLLRACSPEVILQAASLCDGHSILKPEAFVEAGLPTEVVDHLTLTFRSDGTPKGTIFVDGQPVKWLKGVYGLDVLRFLANSLGVDYPSALGRGFEAQNIHRALRQHFDALTPKPAA